MRQIDIKDLSSYVKPFDMEEDAAIAVATDGKETNGLTVGWAGFGILWSKPCLTLYVHKTRYSKHIFDNAKYCSLCFMPKDLKNQVEYYGRVSGRDENKIQKCGMKLNTEDVAPYFEESRAVILCRIMGKSDFDVNNVDSRVLSWYQKDGVHTQYYGEIVKVLVQ